MNFFQILSLSIFRVWFFCIPAPNLVFLKFSFSWKSFQEHTNYDCCIPTPKLSCSWSYLYVFRKWCYEKHAKSATLSALLSDFRCQVWGAVFFVQFVWYLHLASSPWNSCWLGNTTTIRYLTLWSCWLGNTTTIRYLTLWNSCNLGGEGYRKKGALVSLIFCWPEPNPLRVKLPFAFIFLVEDQAYFIIILVLLYRFLSNSCKY